MSRNDRASSDVTQLLARWKQGEDQALDQLWPMVYQQLKALATHQFKRESSGHTLQPTALVNEAYVKLVGGDPGHVGNRIHFFALAAKAMRQVLVDHARRKATAKRAGDRNRVTLADLHASEASPPSTVDTLDLHDALERLATIRPRAARVVELRYFGGLTLDQTAAILDVTPKTVGRDWNTARLWLLERLRPRG